MDVVMGILAGGALPAASFCQAIPWWKFCRPNPRTAKVVRMVAKR